MKFPIDFGIYKLNDNWRLIVYEDYKGSREVKEIKEGSAKSIILELAKEMAFDIIGFRYPSR